MKKILSTVLVLILLVSLAVISPNAAQTALMKVDSTYYTSGTLYAYVESVGGTDPTTLTLKPSSDAGLNADSPKPITETATSIDYVLLIDASGSIQQYVPSVYSFVSSLMGTEALPTTIAVASFGSEFHLIAEGLTTPDEVSYVVENEISYTEDYTDICGSVVSAVEYIHTKNRTNSEVINLVVITDGKTDLGDASAGSILSGAQRAESIITTSPEIILHTMCFGGHWEENTYNALKKGTGINEDIDEGGSTQAAAVAGSKMANMIDSLYTFSLDFDWNYEYAREDIDLRVQVTDNPSSGLELFTVENVANLEHIADADGTEENNAPIIELSTNAPDDSSAPDEADPSVSPADPQDSTEAILTIATQDEAKSPFDKFPWLLWVLIGAGGVLVIAAAVVVTLIILKKKNGGTPPKNPQAASKKKPEGPAIVMKMQMVQGTSPSASKEIKLVDEIIIGSGADCDIIIKDPSVAERNTRIFKDGSVIYIENIAAVQNTYLEGMKIFSRNRLRSQDEISVGNTTFKLLF
ncbi:MAG: FHA domain-containing protein [Ruminococcus sp.]|nr:FHA domain-containing protein [Ruminococcus sp.]